MKSHKIRQNIEIVKLENHYRIYDMDGYFFITEHKEKAFEIADALLRGKEVIL